MKFEDFEEKTVKRETLFSGHIIELAVDDVRLPNGEMAKRELVFHNGAVGIIALTEDKRIILVKQFRKPLEKVILEIPAGKIDTTDGDRLETAQRELEEETGFQAEDWEFLFEFSSAPGFTNEILAIYQATGLKKVDNPLPQDEDELIELHALTLEEAKAAMAAGEIYDGKTILAIQHWELMELRGK